MTATPFWRAALNLLTILQMKAQLILLLLPAVAYTQIDSLATNADGSQLWLTSAYALRGSHPVVNRPRIYAWRSPAPELTVEAPTDRYLDAPYLSSDGKTSGWRFTYPCYGSCMIFAPRTGLRVTRAGKTHDFLGFHLLISRSGQYVVQGGNPPGYYPVLTDLDTGSRTSLTDLTTIPTRHGIADDGAVAGVRQSAPGAALVIDRTGAARSIPIAGEIVGYAISRDARLLIVQARAGSAQDGFAYTILRVDLTTGAQSALVSGTGPFAFDISGDGERILLATERRFGGPGKLLLWDGRLHELGGAEQGYKDLVVSDDGTTAFAVERSNRLLQFHLASRAVEQLLPPFPSNLVQESNAVPGSAVRWSGFGFTRSIRVESETGVVFPVIDATPIALYLQTPWEAPRAAPLTLRIEGDDAYPFELSATLHTAGEVAPWIVSLEQEPFYRDGDKRLIKAAQQDFASLVSPENPARPGTTIHAWLTGLGPLDIPVPTGERGPDNPPSRPVAGVACYLLATADDATATGLELPFVAYAPGLIGVYQVDMTIPPTWPAGLSRVRCESAGHRSSDVWIPIGPPQ